MMKTYLQQGKINRLSKALVSFFQGSFVFVFVLLSTATVANAQSGKTIAEQMINNAPSKTAPRSPAKKTPKKITAKTTSKTSASKGTKRLKRSISEPPAAPIDESDISSANRYRVTLLTGAPGIELWANDNQLGVSNADSQVIAYLSSGDHQLKAKKDGHDLNADLLLKVSVQQTEFDFSDQLSHAISELPPETEETEAEEEFDLVAVLQDYKDPERTHTVTIKDWLAIHKRGMQQILSGNTANEVEAVSSFAQGQIELANDNKDKAISSFNAATIFLPNSALAHFGLGNAYLAANQLIEAAAAYQKAIQLDGGFALPYKQLGDVLMAQGKNKEAAASYQQAKTLGLNSPELRLSLAATQIKTKNCPVAMKELEALQNDNPSSSVFLALGECYAELKRPLAAIEAFNKAIEIDSASAVAYFKVGEIYVDQREYGKAKEALEKALSLDVEGKQVNLKEVQDLIEKSRRRIR